MPSLERTRLKRLDAFSSILGGLSFLTLLQFFGFPEFRFPVGFTLVWTALLSAGLFLESLYRLLVVSDPWRYLSRHPVRYIILLLIAFELSGVATWSSGIEGSNLSSLMGQVYLSISLFAHVGSWLRAAILANRWLTNLRVPVLFLPPLSFALIIAAGSLVLAMPGMRSGGLSLIDAAFTATSAVCVTGLSVIDVGTALSPTGQVMLAFLIQVGGIGTMTVMGLLALWTSGRLSIGERTAFSELLGGERIEETRGIVATTVKATFAIEALGALLLWAAFKDKLPHPLLFGIFHAVSAFCNAGFSLFQDSLAGFSADIAVLSAVMVLVTAGGLGFPAISNLWRAGLTRLVPWRKSEPLTRETRTALFLSCFLVVVGALGIFLDSRMVGSGRSPLEALFQSVTLRTAGFQVESQLAFGPVATWLGVALMVVGASPQSTGGGMKTTVAARLFLRLDPRELGAPRRPLFLTQSFRIALSLAGIYLATAALSGLVMARIEGAGVTDTMFESFSALGTVGLSRGLTPGLSLPSKLLVMLLMFSGRVLYPTLVVGIVRRKRKAGGDAGWA
jgi:trk system potassium uptake protein TrkH